MLDLQRNSRLDQLESQHLHAYIYYSYIADYYSYEKKIFQQHIKGDPSGPRWIRLSIGKSVLIR